jgi:hypothetical protein
MIKEMTFLMAGGVGSIFFGMELMSNLTSENIAKSAIYR